jgi:hypothetical protein
VVDVPDVIISCIVAKDFISAISESDIVPERDSFSLPTDSTKNQDMREVLVDSPEIAIV